MKNNHIRKNLQFSDEFTEYIIKHPEVMKTIPKKAYIFFAHKKDVGFTRDNMTLARKIAEKKKVRCYKAEKKSRGWAVYQFDPAAV